MTRQEFISLLKNPHNIKPDQADQVKELRLQYPYFFSLRMLHLKNLLATNDISFEDELSRSVVYATDRRWLYYYLYPQENPDNEIPKYTRTEKRTGSYFELIEAVEQQGGDVDKSLKQLADRLKAARLQLTPDSAEKRISGSRSGKKPEDTQVANKVISMPVEVEKDETETVKLLLQQKKYEEALVILRKLNLNNPKKSIYFADQIRFVEKIIANTKK